MDYYSSSRGSRGSYRGSSYRGSSRGDTRGSRGSRGFSSRGRGFYSSTSYSKYESESSPKYSSSHDKYVSSSSSYPRSDEYYSRRTDSFGSREHRSDISDLASRKRERSDSYSQGVSRRSHDEDQYRSSSRYASSSNSGGSYPSQSYSEARPYEETRVFKKPRVEFKPDYKSEHRVKEPLRTRGAPRGRSGFRGSFSARSGVRGSLSLRGPRGDSFVGRRSSYGTLRSSTTASTSEILAIRRAKLLQKRLKEEKSTAASAAETKEKAKLEGVEDDGKEEEAVSEEPAKVAVEKEMVTASGKPFMKLECPACHAKCVTFREYSVHLTQPLHMAALRLKADELRASLAAMRIEQRELQKKIEEEDLTSLNTVGHFCLICKLHYSQTRATHEKSELHKKLKEFLLPTCQVCRFNFESPLLYEKHLCSLSHLKHCYQRDVPEREFMVLDSVGSGDEADDKEEERAKESKESPEEKEEDLMLGLEFIHEVKGMYCEVCRVFLPRARNYSHILNRHCRTKDHLRFYLHFGNEKLLERMSAQEEKSAKDEAAKETEEPLDEAKLWDGLSEILDEAQPPKSDDEDDEEGGRFDRFKSKEKVENGELELKEEDVTIDEVTTAVADTSVDPQEPEPVPA